MTTKQYLMEVHRMRRRIVSLKQREEEVRTAAEGLRAMRCDKDKVQKSVVNRIDAIMADLISAQEEYANAIKECNEQIRIREKQIERMDQQRHEEILRLRYFDHDEHGNQLTLQAIARTMGINYNWARHIHGEALAAFGKKYAKIIAKK